ncbi:hypothetical protein AN958_02975 [Leucoagaricus sp. SymC.cos]|nr:hypothetical protein AN958_02975 [Leucoagaricus sp. SymC.cos]
MVTIIVALYALSILHLACRWEMVRYAFVLKGSTTASILRSLLHVPTWTVVCSTLSLSLMTLTADCVMIWRCWVVWDRDWRAPVLPLLATIIGTAFCGLSLMDQIRPRDPYVTSNRTKFTNSAIIYFSLSLISTVLSTLLIIIRIVILSRTNRIRSQYTGIISIITESAALYAIILIIFLPWYARKDFSQGYIQAILVPITGIAPTIVTARVALRLSQDRMMNKSSAPDLTNWETTNPSSSGIHDCLDASLDPAGGHGGKERDSEQRPA